MKKVLLVVCALLPLAATIASAEVSLTEKQRLRESLGAPANVSMEHALMLTGAKGASSTNFIDASGLKYFINTDIDFLTTSSGEGAMEEASYTHAVAASTLNGGTTSSTLNDMFDGYNELYVNGQQYGAEIVGGVTNTRGVAVTESNQRQLVTGPQSIAGMTVWRKIFVPANDEFARWLNYVQNTSGAPISVTVSNSNNLGSDSNTKLDFSSTGLPDTNVETSLATTWITTFQAFSGNSSSDPRIGHVPQGVSRRVSLSSIIFTNGDDNPSWAHTFTVAPGETAIIAWFVTGQPTKSAARAKAAELAAGTNPHMWDFMGGADKAAVKNFNATGGAPNDYDGDGRSDPGVYDPLRYKWFILESTAGYTESPKPGNILVPVEGDFDGDGISDIAGYNNLNGNWIIQNSGSLPRSARYASLVTTQQFGFYGAQPVPADYDGDGRTDLAVYDTGGFYFILQSTAGFVADQWNFSSTDLASTVPVPGDYDGDGKADLAVYELTSGNWRIRNSGTLPAETDIQFGFTGAKPVPADYDGDGKTDIAVYDPIRAIWYIMGSTAGFSQIQFGAHGMVPVIGDYDGDGKTDITVYSRLQGQWYRLLSTAGFDTFQFGYFLAQPLGAP